MNGPVWMAFLQLAMASLGQDSARPSDDPADRAVREFRNNDWPVAEFPGVVEARPVEHLPEHIPGPDVVPAGSLRRGVAVSFKRHVTFRSGDSGLDTMRDLIHTDQLVMSYGIAGAAKKVHMLPDEAITKAP